MRLTRCILSILAFISLTAHAHADADQTGVCDMLTALKEISAGLEAGLPADQLPQTRAELIHIAKQIAIGNFDRPPSTVDLGYLRRLANTLQLRLQAAAVNPGQTAPGAVRKVSQGLSRLDNIQVNLKCRKSEETAGVPGASKERSGPSGLPSQDSFPEQMNDPDFTIGAPTLIAFAVIASAIAISIYYFWFRPQKQRFRRRPCHTPVLMAGRDNCTVSYMLDIARGGTKVEAPGKPLAENVVDLYFCGHRIKGKVVWRNAFFLGFHFEEQISQQAVDDVVGGSVKSPRTDGIEKNATSCYFPGCHIDCPHHIPTAITERGSGMSA